MYTIKISARARHMRIMVRIGGDVVVTTPPNISSVQVEKWVQEKSAWIEKKVNLMLRYVKIKKVQRSKKEIIELKQKTRVFVEERLEHFNALYGYTWHRITVRAQKTRWGSCSRQGNLNFNYKIILLPQRLAEYVVVHELCHLGEFNHSKDFWNLVARTMPDYVGLRKELKLVREASL